MRWALPFLLSVVVLLMTTVIAFGNISDSDQSEEHVIIKGNINCDAYFGGALDTLEHLTALAGFKGVPLYCVRTEQYEDGCPTVNPGPTQCDTPPYPVNSPGPTSGPGELPVAVLDINCDQEVDARDSLSLLKASAMANYEPFSPGCGGLGSETQPTSE